MTSRRSFLKQSAAGAAVGITRTSTVEADSRNDRMPVAVVGCGGMGAEHLTRLTQRDDVEVRYVCDVDALRLAAAAKTVEAAGKAPQAVKDFRGILDDRDVVAVWHATPDHWHTPGAILTADAGKHVYVEKPCSHNVREGRLLVEAGDRNNVVIQVGTQSRSTRTVVEAMRRIHDGMIGDIVVAKAWNSQLRENLGDVRASPPPAELDFELWQGPAPEAPFYSNRIPYAWRFFFSYGVGDMGNDGVHNVDVAAWGLQLDRLEPFQTFARMIEDPWDGIEAYCHAENKVPLGFVEGINNKIRVIQRRAYGFRDEEYLRLKILTCMLPKL